MSTKLYSAIWTANAVLGVAGATVVSAGGSIMCFARDLPVLGMFWLGLSVLMVVFASRVRFPSIEEIGQNLDAKAQAVGGPFLYFCFLKLKGKWCWFCFGASARKTVERVFAIDV